MKVTKITAAIGVGLFVLGLGFLGCGASTKTQSATPANNKEYARTSVMVTLANGRSGGSGVVIKSSPSGSLVLTNLHVCNLIQGGGVVKNESNTYPISTYRVYTKNDLCALTVQADLGVNTVVASQAPEVYSGLTVAGHPALLPTAITNGHFSSRMPIQMMVAMEPCDGSEQSEMDQMYCLFAGGKPVLKQFDAQFTTTTIMPGSSGSGVFNDKGELAGLVFAGPGDGLGYGFIVPFEYVRDFLSNLSSYQLRTPDPSLKPVNYFLHPDAFKALCSELRSKPNSIDCFNVTFPEIVIDNE